MNMKSKFLDYIGQLRIYSLVDLTLLLYVIDSNKYELIGGILLHISFLAYLESEHKHKYRAIMPKWIWIILLIPGILLYNHFSVLGFIIVSYFYTLKNKKYYGPIAPLLRGMQCLFLVGGVAGYESFITWLVLPIIFIRNLIGDVRDIEKDRKEDLKTLPIIFGLKKSIPYIHLSFLLFTSLIWFSYSTFRYYYLIGIWVIEVTTYNLTKR